MEAETFYEEIKTIGSGTLYISIPDKLARFSGFKKGDKIKVMIKKIK